MTTFDDTAFFTLACGRVGGVVPVGRVSIEALLEVLALALVPVDDQVRGEDAVAFWVGIDALDRLGCELLKDLPGACNLGLGRSRMWS
jgi:hypothetical protein